MREKRTGLRIKKTFAEVVSQSADQRNSSGAALDSPGSL